MKIFFPMRPLGFLLTVLGVALSMQTAFAVTRTWIGNTSQYWDVPANWSGTAVPLATDEVVIPAVVPGFNCVIRTAVTRTTTTVSDGSLNIDATGTLTNSSTISFNNQGGFVITSGGTFNNSVGGTLTMNDNNSSGLYNSGGTINNAGTITVSSITYAWNEGTIANTGTFTNNGAYFGTGTFQSSTFVNPAGGNVGIPPALGPLVDCIAFNNGFTNNGTVIFDLGAGAACTGFDRITVTGLATLGGTFTASGTVSLGNTFVVMTYSSRSGTFSNSNVNLGGGMFANISYTATQATLTIGSAPLPVELLRFEASTKEGKNQLIWATASEVNAKAFDIERSADGRAFASLRQIEAANKPHSYQFVDDQPFVTSYYRLRQTDLDGTATYSKVVSVTLTGVTKGLRAYPTLVMDGFLTVDTEGLDTADFTIYNLLGQLVQRGQVASPVDVSALAKGNYILQVGSEQTQFMKQ